LSTKTIITLKVIPRFEYDYNSKVVCWRKAGSIASDITNAALEAGLDPFRDIETEIDGDNVIVKAVLET
jgi:hypothetical protein